MGQVKTRIELDKGNSKEYEIEVIRDSEIYTRELKSHLSGFYYLVSLKSYLEEENT